MAASPKSVRKKITRKPKSAPAQYGKTARGKLVVNVPPPPNTLPKTTRWMQAGFFVPFIALESWFAWAFALDMFARCNYVDAYILPNSCQPNGKLYLILLMIISISLIFLGVFAARLAYRQGIRWRFLVIYVAAMLVGQYMLVRFLSKLFF